jgi:hypothetical protein
VPTSASTCFATDHVTSGASALPFEKACGGSLSLPSQFKRPPCAARARRTVLILRLSGANYLDDGGSGSGADAWSARYIHLPPIFFATAVTRTVSVCGVPPAFGCIVSVAVP